MQWLSKNKIVYACHLPMCFMPIQKNRTKIYLKLIFFFSHQKSQGNYFIVHFPIDNINRLKKQAQENVVCSDKGLRGIVSSISAVLLMLTASFCMCPFHSGTGLFCLLEQAMLQVPIMCISTWPSSADCHNLYTYTNIHKYRLHKNAFVCIHCLIGHCSKM